MYCRIRELNETETNVLEDFLYEAIFIPKGVEKPSRDIINEPELQIYIKDFGTKRGDFCLVAEVENKIVGAAWSRIINDYGHIDNETPSLSISLYNEYRGLGIGTELMNQLLDLLKNKGFKQSSLSVQKANYASKMYRKLGFEIVRENDEVYVMAIKLDC